MKAILTDVTRCIGCHECIQACTEANHLGPDLPDPEEALDGLSAQRWTTLVKPSPGHYVRKHCQHCLEPSCASACPVGAMHKTPEGPVIYDGHRCMGCRYCMMACPYGIPRYQWDQPVPYVRKCTLCYERLQAGGQPACVEACPEAATIFGEREALLAEAKRRLQAQPERYYPQVFGEHEVGGTSVLYVSDIPLDFLGFRGQYPGTEPMPELTWKVLNKVPLVALGVGALMAGTYWIIERRMEVSHAEGMEEHPTSEEEEGRANC